MATWLLAPLMNAFDSPEVAWFAPEIKACIGYNTFYAGKLDEARKWFEEAWEGYLQRPETERVSPFWPLPNDPVAVTAVALACISALQGDFEASAEWEGRAISVAEQIGFPRGPWSLAFVMTYLAWLRMVMGDESASREFGQKTLDLAEQHRFDYFRAIGYQYLLVPDDDISANPDELTTWEAAMDMVGHAAFRAAFHWIAARTHAVQGDPKRALEEADEGLAWVEKSGERIHLPYLLLLRANLLLSGGSGREEDAVGDLIAARDIATCQGSTVMASRASDALAKLQT
jgi:hypothetical protein